MLWAPQFVSNNKFELCSNFFVQYHLELRFIRVWLNSTPVFYENAKVHKYYNMFSYFVQNHRKPLHREVHPPSCPWWCPCRGVAARWPSGCWSSRRRGRAASAPSSWPGDGASSSSSCGWGQEWPSWQICGKKGRLKMLVKLVVKMSRGQLELLIKRNSIKMTKYEEYFCWQQQTYVNSRMSF